MLVYVEGMYRTMVLYGYAERRCPVLEGHVSIRSDSVLYTDNNDMRLCLRNVCVILASHCPEVDCRWAPKYANKYKYKKRRNMNINKLKIN